MSPRLGIDQIEVKHRYTMLVTDIDGHPVEGATVVYILKKNGSEYNRGKYITKSNGKFIKNVSHILSHPFRFSSGIICKTFKEGYFTTISKIEVKNDWFQIASFSDILMKPTDDACKIFLSLEEHNALKDKIFNFLDMIFVQSPFLDVGAELKVNSIDVIQFKEHKYLSFYFVADTVYDSSKMNEYDIGKILFDEVVEKYLAPLDKYISDPKLFYGYDLVVEGVKKDILVSFSKAKKLKYRFLVPQETAKRYRSKDISQQEVLDSSTILINDNRIELKF
jgi:hypothetical protein